MVFEYVILLIFLIVILILVILIPFFSTSIVHQENYQEKVSSYECGFEPFETYMSQFEVRYYLVAILFLIFDIELVFLMPWILTFHYIAPYLLLSMATFFFFSINCFLLWVTNWWLGMGLGVIYDVLKSTPVPFITFIKLNLKKWLEAIIFNYTGPELYVSKENLFLILQFLQLNTFVRLKTFVDLAVTDYPFKEVRFRLSYNFLSLYSQRLSINLYVGLQNVLMSIRSLFKSADWLEREAWDMYGIFFLNHNDLRRILTDYGFRGFPFRKDFPLTGYIELRFDDTKGDVTYEPLELAQELRFFNFSSGWEKDF